MKFTKEQAFENLKAILTNNGKKTLRMSEKSINAQLDVLMPLVANEEMELSDFVDKVKVSFETMNGNAEADNAAFVRQWKKEHPATEQNKQAEETKEENPNNQTAMIPQEFLDRLTALEKEKSERETREKLSSKRAELISAMEKEGIKDKEWIGEFLKEVNITEDLNVDEKAKSYVKFYNKSNANTTTSATPFGATKSANTKKPFEDLGKYLNAQNTNNALVGNNTN